MTAPMFGSWLEETGRLQREAFDVNVDLLPDVELADYITWNVTALVAELGEFLAEVPSWKPWVADRGKVIHRDRAVQELVDVLHFVANLACALGLSDDELSARYAAKQQVNRSRQAGLYEAETNKDENGNATDEPESEGWD
jgi:dimeric dUTPase (all-alpha-NTP-PPase superfamily)